MVVAATRRKSYLTVMTRATATSARPFARATLIAAAGGGILVALAVVLWARYGVAVFHETIVAGLALCF